MFDIEAKNWIEFVVAGTYDGQNFEHHKSIKGMLEHLFADKKDKVVFAHNGCNYDFRFLLQEIYVFSQGEYEVVNSLSTPAGFFVLSIQKTSGDNEAVIEFRDSIRLLPFSLRSLCETFGTKTLKGDIDYDKIDKITPELLSYLEDDCKGLWQSLALYKEIPWVKRSGLALTTASQSIRVLQLYLDQEIHSLPPRVDEFVRRGYFGGRTEIFRPFFQGDDENPYITCVDANSLYPSVMQAPYEYPIAFDCRTKVYNPKKLSIWDVEVEVPKDMFLPPLGIAVTIDEETNEAVFSEERGGKFIFPTGKFRGVFCSPEIEYAKSLGVKILKYHEGVEFVNGGCIFDDFVQDFWQERKKAKAAKNGLMETFCKLMLNSNYGRHGLNPERESLVLFDGEEEGVKPTHQIEVPLTKAQQKRFQINAPKGLLIFASKTERVNSYSNVAISAFVTSYARVKMHKFYMRYADRIYYTDTDSIFLHGEIEGSNELGGLKYEYKAKKACFLLPKCYALGGIEDLFKKGEKVNLKTVMKGVREELVKLSGVSVDEFYEILAGEFHLHKKYLMDPKLYFVSKDPVVAKLRTSMQKGSFLATEENTVKTIQSRYDKRELYVDKKGKWTSRPLHIENGRVVNYKGNRLQYAANEKKKESSRIVRASNLRPEYRGDDLEGKNL